MELFIRNLNQSEDAFFRFSRKILDSSDSLYDLASKPLESAITYIENYHKSVIVPELAAAKRTNSGSTTVVKSAKELKHLLGSNSDSNPGSVSVSLPVLAMMFNKNNYNNNSKPNAGQINDSKKRKVNIEKEEVRKKHAGNYKKSELDNKVKADKSDTPPAKIDEHTKKAGKQVCYAFQKGEECSWGDNCHFRHSN